MGGSEQQITAKKPRGKPFVPGDPRINRQGVPIEAVALARALREATADVLLGPSPRHPDKTRLECILEALADKAERGDARAAEILFERIGGRPTQPEAEASEQGDIVINWGGPPPVWALPRQPVPSLPCQLGDGQRSLDGLPYNPEDRDK